MAIQWFFHHQLSLYPLSMLLRPWLACLLHSVGKSEGDDATRHDDNHLTSNTVSIIHPPLVPRPYPNAYKLSRGTNTKLIRLI